MEVRTVGRWQDLQLKHSGQCRKTTLESRPEKGEGESQAAIGEDKGSKRGNSDKGPEVTIHWYLSYHLINHNYANNLRL